MIEYLVKRNQIEKFKFDRPSTKLNKIYNQNHNCN